MSVASLLRTPEPAPRRRAVLTVVPVREVAAPRAPFVVAVVALLVTGLIGLLVLNTVLGKDSFHLFELRSENRALLDQEQVLVREVEMLRSPSTIAGKAAGLGMVPAGPPAFLRLPDGAVLGSAEVAQAPVVEEPLHEGTAVEEPAAETSTDETTSDASTDDASTDDE
ncbi:MAG: hypothetical protein LH469_04145 [Frankiaceae bacterium]|nr:hypothetical protein [Frankiaceae bacterium]